MENKTTKMCEKDTRPRLRETRLIRLIRDIREITTQPLMDKKNFGYLRNVVGPHIHVGYNAESQDIKVRVDHANKDVQVDVAILCYQYTGGKLIHSIQQYCKDNGLPLIIEEVWRYDKNSQK